ncbi:MAG: DUF2807 domain-containing protein [Sporomusaceae bacterium]|jgi:hypothetical protein|nr:DUF2807 domain-containing protein [Sporomusaceae bacterium]
MKTKLFWLLILLMPIIVFAIFPLGENYPIKAQEPGIVVHEAPESKKYEFVNGYRSLKIASNQVDLIFKVVDTSLPYLKVTADSNLLKQIKIELKERNPQNPTDKNTQLSISVAGNIPPAKEIICEIGVNSLYNIDIDSDAKVRFAGVLTGESKRGVGKAMDITHAGSGQAELTINVDEVKFDAENSSGTIIIQGESKDTFTVFSCGVACKLDLSRLISADIELNGSGLVTVAPKKFLSTSLQEPGGVLYLR